MNESATNIRTDESMPTRLAAGASGKTCAAKSFVGSAMGLNGASETVLPIVSALSIAVRG